MPKKPLIIFWFRRDLRLHDNAALYHALNSSKMVQPLFIFDRNILDKLSQKDDPRVTFIYQTVQTLNEELRPFNSSIIIKNDDPLNAFKQLLDEFEIEAVYTNHDYEPYARERDAAIQSLLASLGVSFYSFKDHVIFEKDEILKADKKPYTVFTPYKRIWLSKLNNRYYTKSYATKNLFAHFNQTAFKYFPSLNEIGFEESSLAFPGKNYQHIIENYHHTRNFPALAGTSRIGIHLRFGTISIREAVQNALKAADKTWLNELIWRDFYAMTLWHFPHTLDHSFKSQYDKIQWRNNENDFLAWCEGRTGYPIVDAGMRELNTTGYMHNRVRMITASFLTKHLLIDWRWGEAYFAQKLLDYDQASNIGGWQWAAGSGNDAAPYFRIFNPELQIKKFDPELKYIRKWVPEFDDCFKYPRPIVEHPFARERALRVFKEALGSRR